MNVIYRYPLSIGRNKLLLPNDSKILKFGSQGNMMSVWVLHNINNSNYYEYVYVYPTGRPIDYIDFDYIGTSILECNEVYHAFKLKNN